MTERTHYQQGYDRRVPHQEGTPALAILPYPERRDRQVRVPQVLRNDFYGETVINNKPRLDLALSPTVLKEAREQRNIGTFLYVPKQFFHGTQPQDNYTPATRRFIEAQLDNQGEQYLRENPIVTIPIPTLEHTTEGNVPSVRLAIADGHHKFRYSSRINARILPTLTFSLDEYAQLYNADKPQHKQLTQEQLFNIMNDRMAEAQECFGSRLAAKGKHELHPRAVVGATEIPQLVSLFGDPDMHV